MATGEVDLFSYLLRVFFALLVMVLVAFTFVRVAKSKGWVRQNEAHVKIMASLPLGRDVFFVLQCGPDVIAFTSGKVGVCLMGRWKYEEWMQQERKNGDEKNKTVVK